jgi:hypothetical protein
MNRYKNDLLEIWEDTKYIIKIIIIILLLTELVILHDKYIGFMPSSITQDYL